MERTMGESKRYLFQAVLEALSASVLKKSRPEMLISQSRNCCAKRGFLFHDFIF
jgi:hypothetical protein